MQGDAKKFKSNGSLMRLTAANVYAVRRALEKADIEFVLECGGSVDVRLKKPQSTG